MSLRLYSVSQKYKQNVILKPMSINISNGITGLIGKNGAGKSTLLKILATIESPYSGYIELDQVNYYKDRKFACESIGYLPQLFGVYKNMKVIEFIDYIACLKGVSMRKNKNYFDTLLVVLNLHGILKKPLGSLSGGMIQRVGIMQALINNPRVLILDEPTVGLDYIEKERLYNYLREISLEKIIIISSHMIEDITSYSDNIIILDDGGLIVNDTVENVANCYLINQSY